MLYGLNASPAADELPSQRELRISVSLRAVLPIFSAEPPACATDGHRLTSNADKTMILFILNYLIQLFQDGTLAPFLRS